MELAALGRNVFKKYLKGILKLKEDDIAEFEFLEPQISIAPGQACVLYRGEEVLGGGWIVKKL